MTSTTEQNVTQAVVKRDNSPAALVRSYGNDFKSVMPTHIKGDAWLRIAVGALKKGRKQGDRYELEIAAANNPGVFLAALLDAARLGLEPGTEQYYLTPRKVDGKLQILGIVGYQGIIELMYRAGAISSVVAEVVYSNDTFAFQPGRDEIPRHEIDWDSPDRGELRLAYAFARMKDGATSKVVVLNRADIERVKKSSQGSDSKYSPWVNHEPSMWLKSCVRQLSKWVPTSAEYVIHAERVKAARDQEQQHDLSGPLLEQIPGGQVNRSTGEMFDGDLDGDVIDGAIVEDVDEPAWPESAQVPA